MSNGRFTMQNEPVRQHWVPKVYLRGFCAEPTEREQIHVHDTREGRSFLSSIDKIAVKNHFYTLALGLEARSYVVEHAFARLESDVGPVLAALRKSQELPTDIEALSVLAEFVATLYMRTRQGLQIIYGHREEVRFRSSLQPVSKGSFTSELLEFDDEEMRELFAKSSIVVGKRIANHLAVMHWRLLHATEDYFITSENPVYSFHSTEQQWGLGTAGAYTLFPISPALLLHISNEAVIPGEGTYELPAMGVRGLNGLTLLSAEQFVFSHFPFDGIADLLSEREKGQPRAFGPAGNVSA